MHRRTIFITGYPYARDSYRRTFESWPVDGPEAHLIVPREWPIKGGKVIYRPGADVRTTLISTYFAHSNYPLIGGLLKGWTPGLPIVLFRKARRGDLLFTALEPTLLSALYNGVVAKILGLRHVLFTWENIPYEEKHHGVSLFIKRMVLALNRWFSDGIVCGNKKASIIMGCHGFNKRVIIPLSGVDPEQFKPRNVAGHYPALERKVVYTYAGAIGFRKGIHVLLRALPKVLEAIPNAHVVIVGNGNYESEVDEFIEEYDLREHVTRFPWLDHHDLVRLFSVSDVFVYPSIPYEGWAEQFGYSMAEASLMELPVISTSSGSIDEVVRDGSTGILVEPDDAERLSDEMTHLGMDETLRSSMGHSGRAYISSHFSHSVISARLAAFFSKIR